MLTRSEIRAVRSACLRGRRDGSTEHAMQALFVLPEYDKGTRKGEDGVSAATRDKASGVQSDCAVLQCVLFGRRSKASATKCRKSWHRASQYGCSFGNCAKCCKRTEVLHAVDTHLPGYPVPGYCPACPWSIALSLRHRMQWPYMPVRKPCGALHVMTVWRLLW